MGKRSNFERRERDFYPTPVEAVVPLLAHLEPRTVFIEPCAGAGDLARHLRAVGHQCIERVDIEPRAPGIFEADATVHRWAEDAGHFDCFITNPPWSREDLHKIIVNLSDQAPAWLLFDADWSHTRQPRPVSRASARS
jgi:hypothetical protein